MKIQVEIMKYRKKTVVLLKCNIAGTTIETTDGTPTRSKQVV